MSKITQVAKGIENKHMKNQSESVIAIVGLGYVGLPLALEFGTHFETIGIDGS